MTFDELLEQIVVLLQRDGRVTYRALKRRFDLDDDYLTDLCGEIIKAKRVAVDETGEVLVWAGKGDAAKQEPENRRKRTLPFLTLDPLPTRLPTLPNVFALNKSRWKPAARVTGSAKPSRLSLPI